MHLRTLPSNRNLRGKRVIVRVDWNVPLGKPLDGESGLKIERSRATLRELKRRGAIVIILTHLGRPDGSDPHFSTRRLLPMLRRFGLRPQFHAADPNQPRAWNELAEALRQAEPGSLHLLENVRFWKGEETNSPKLIRSYAALGQIFLNDAFASCHRAHVSVAGLARALPSYAGPSLAFEVETLQSLLEKPARPFYAIIGGLKLSSKVPVLRALLPLCERVFVGGAMASTFLAAQDIPTGRSLVEKSALEEARALLTQFKHKLALPVDVMVTERLSSRPRLQTLSIYSVPDRGMIVDHGPKTHEVWAYELGQAKTILWNGPVGVAEIPACAQGSLHLAQTLARLARRKAFVIAGGGDTIPVLARAHALKKLSFVSTGGGALLEFMAKKGRLPGLIPLRKK